MLRFLRKSFKGESGSTLLVTTMVIAAISVMVLVSLGISSRNLISTSQNYKDSQFVFYAVEGSVQETLQHATNDSNWPTVNDYTDSYTFDGVSIERHIVSSPSSRVYEITGSYRSVFRKLIVTDDKVNNTLTFEEAIP